MEERYKDLIGKNIFVILKTGRKYSGVVISVKNDMVSLTDKYNELVIFNIFEISSLEVEKDD